MSTNPKLQTIPQPSFAEVAVPVHVNQTFTYKLSPEQAAIASPGARIVIPFGNKFLTGYIVGLKEASDLNLSLLGKEIKEAREVVDSFPVCTEEILTVTKWVSEYYSSPWGEVIKAALPPGISPAIHELYSLTESGRSLLSQNVEDAIEFQILTRIHELTQIQKKQLADIAGTALPITARSRTTRIIERNSSQLK